LTSLLSEAYWNKYSRSIPITWFCWVFLGFLHQLKL
jgi:hypothetical protein